TFFRRKRSDCINREGCFAMVSCKRCAEENLPCKLSSLSERCGNCEKVGATSCAPVDIPIPNFSRINREMEKLRKQEEETDKALEAQEAIAEAALSEMRALRAKARRLRKQKAILKQKEQQIFNTGAEDAADIEVLERWAHLNNAVALVNPKAPA
ncbi:hypothetical protein SLS61_010207, partial [Didymella pomorum]